MASSIDNRDHCDSVLRGLFSAVIGGLIASALTDATHTHLRVKRWVRRQPRFHLHFIPTSSSWLNLVERWFRDLMARRIRRGVFRSVPELI